MILQRVNAEAGTSCWKVSGRWNAAMLFSLMSMSLYFNDALEVAQVTAFCPEVGMHEPLVRMPHNTGPTVFSLFGIIRTPTGPLHASLVPESLTRDSVATHRVHGNTVPA